MKTEKTNTQKTISLTEKETMTLKTIGKALLEELKAGQLKGTTVELLETYSKELDLSGNSHWLAEEVAGELIKTGSFEDLSYNELVLVKVVYEDGVKDCKILLTKYFLRGLWDSIRERKEVLESTLQKVYTRMEALDSLFTEGLGFELPSIPSDSTVLTEFTPRKIEELVQGRKVTFEQLDMAIYTLRDFGETVGYTKEGYLYLQTLTGEEYLTPEELVEAAREEYEVLEGEEDDQE